MAAASAAIVLFWGVPTPREDLSWNDGIEVRLDRLQSQLELAQWAGETRAVEVFEWEIQQLRSEGDTLEG